MSKAWHSVEIARHSLRPTARYYIDAMIEGFIELHGDRLYGDDPALIGGLGYLNGRAVTVLAQEKGRDTNEKLQRNFGSMNPEGYRKALRLMKQAERFGRPVVCLVDTQGAYPGIGAEERGQGAAIATNLAEMMALRVPVVSAILGEGGSGGALALAVSDRVAVLENAVYSVLSPEGFAAILWRDASRAKEAAEVMKLTAEDLKALGVIDDIIPEPQGGAHMDPKAIAARLQGYLADTLHKLCAQETDALLAARYQKFRGMGEFLVG